MKRKIKNNTKVIILFCLAFLMFNCQNDENSSDRLKNKIETVSIDEAKSFLIDSKNNSSAKSANNELEKLEFNKIAQEKINGSDEFLTVIPFTSHSELENDRILLLKINNEIKSVVFRMYPDDDSAKGSFSGNLFTYSLSGNFINGFRAKNGVIISQFFENTNALKTNTENSKTPTLTRRAPIQLNEVVVQGSSSKTVHALDMFGVDGMFVDIDGGNAYYSWDVGDGGSSTDYTNTIVPPSCESFNFVRKKGANWQEALIKNVSFKIVLLTPPKHIQITQIITYIQPISFGMPINFNKGDIDVTPGVAATVSARILQLAMDKTVAKYGRSEVSELTVSLYFKEQLIKEYREYTNGGIVNFNSTSNVTPTEYKTNPQSSGNCD